MNICFLYFCLQKLSAAAELDSDFSLLYPDSSMPHVIFGAVTYTYSLGLPEILPRRILFSFRLKIEV